MSQRSVFLALAVLTPVAVHAQSEAEICVSLLVPNGQSPDAAPRLVIGESQSVQPSARTSCVKVKTVPVRLHLDTGSPNQFNWNVAERLDIVVCKWPPQLRLAGWHITLASRVQECEQ